MGKNLFKLILLIFSISLMSCKDKSTENSSLSASNYDIVLSGWNGKMGQEDHIIRLNTDGSFTQSVISWKDSCGKISSANYNKLISELNISELMQISLYHNESCGDAQGGKQTTKLILTDKESNKTNTIRWSDCENDEANKALIVKLNLIRDHINNVITITGKHLCN